MMHTLKTDPGPFEAQMAGVKRFEFRCDDRTPRFEIGDALDLVENPPGEHRCFPRRLMVYVEYIVRGPAYGVPDGYCVMSTSRAMQWWPGDDRT